MSATGSRAVGGRSDAPRSSNAGSSPMSARPELDAVVSARREPLLLAPITLRGLTARNRIVVSPMSQYAAVDGAPTDWHLVHLGKFAMGGAGIVFVEETTVEERARKTYHCPGIYTDAQARAWRRLPSEMARTRPPTTPGTSWCSRRTGMVP